MKGYIVRTTDGVTEETYFFENEEYAIQYVLADMEDLASMYADSDDMVTECDYPHYVLQLVDSEVYYEWEIEEVDAWV